MPIYDGILIFSSVERREAFSLSLAHHEHRAYTNFLKNKDLSFSLMQPHCELGLSAIHGCGYMIGKQERDYLIRCFLRGFLG